MSQCPCDWSCSRNCSRWLGGQYPNQLPNQPHAHPEPPGPPYNYKVMPITVLRGINPGFPGLSPSSGVRLRTCSAPVCRSPAVGIATTCCPSTYT